AVRDHRARRTAGRVVGAEHEVIDEELRAAAKQVGERSAARLGVESISLVDADPGQLAALPRELVAAPGELLLGREQLDPRGPPFLACSGRMRGHQLSLRWVSSAVPCA